MKFVKPLTPAEQVKQLEDWCRRAEDSSIGALREFPDAALLRLTGLKIAAQSLP